MPAVENYGVGNITFFFDTIRAVERKPQGVLIKTDNSEYLVPHQDEGLPHLRIGRKMLVVFFSGCIKAVFVRPRITLLRLFGSGGEPDHTALKRLRPKYLASEHRINILSRFVA